MDPEFNPQRDFAAKRVFEGNQSILQDGHEFTLRHDYIGPDPDWVEPPNYAAPPPTEARIEMPGDTGKAGVLERAAAKLDGFSENENLSDNNKENKLAKDAERLAV